MKKLTENELKYLKKKKKNPHRGMEVAMNIFIRFNSRTEYVSSLHSQLIWIT